MRNRRRNFASIYKDVYKNAKPFPHLVIDNFLESSHAVKLSKCFQTELKNNKYMCHMIGKNHFIRKSNQKEYISILQILHVLNRHNSEVLYISHNKSLIEHLDNINACHTYLVKTKGITNNDIQKISKMFDFGV